MEEFYYEEPIKKHLFLKCLIFIFIIGLIIGIFIYYKEKNTIKLKNMNIELGSTLSKDVNDYLKSGKRFSNEYKLYLDDVDVNTIGKYSYKVKYNKHTKIGYINVVDTTKPEVVIDDSIEIGTNDTFDPNILITSCKDASLPCTATLKNEKDYDKLKNIGTYNIDIKISDTANNYVIKNVTINVSENGDMSSKVSNDLNYYTNSENDDKIGHVLFVKLDKAINEDTLEYEGIIQETSTIDFSKYVDGEIYSTRLITAYNRYGYVIGIQVEVTLTNGDKKLIENKGETNEETEKTEEQ